MIVSGAAVCHCRECTQRDERKQPSKSSHRSRGDARVWREPAELALHLLRWQSTKPSTSKAFLASFAPATMKSIQQEKRLVSALASEECLCEPVLANSGNDILCIYKSLVWQGALLFRRPWHLPRSASQRDSHFGKRSASTLARSKKDDGPTDRQSDSNKTSSGADSHDDLAPLRKMMAVKAKAENAPKPKFSLQNAVARQWNAFTSLAPG